MNKIKFYEALYTSCSYIVARRKSIVLPILIIVAGIVLPLASTMLLKGSEFDNINSAVILLGIALAIGGAIWLLGRVNGKGEPFHTVKGKFLVTKTLSYDRSRRSEVLKAMGSGNLEALLAVPDSFREGSFGLGAGRLRTTFKVVLPSAVPGILSGVILAIGRIVGETAALIYTAGTVAKVPESLFDSTRTLAVHMYTISTEGLHVDQSYATAVVLLVLVLGINSLSALIAKRVGRRSQ